VAANRSRRRTEPDARPGHGAEQPRPRPDHVEIHVRPAGGQKREGDAATHEVAAGAGGDGDVVGDLPGDADPEHARMCAESGADREAVLRGAPLSVKRSRHRVVALYGGLALVAGGQDDDFRALSSVEIYDPDGGGASAVLAQGLSHGRLGFTITVLDDGEMLFVAGAEMDGGTYADVPAVDRLRVGW
jgi:hypothetical protein